MKTVVIQSAAPHQKIGWVEACLASVRGWAERQGLSYAFYGDEIFEALPDAVMEKYLDQPVVRSDLARLLKTQEFLAGGADRVVWADADFLIFAPKDFIVPDEVPFAFGREVWVQEGAGGKLRAYPKIHNAFFVFGEENAFLDFYIHSALKLLERAEAPVVPQFIGPKFLTTQHNMIGFDEIKSAAMFSPLVMRDILAGGGPALSLMLEKQESPVYGANLSLSHVGREVDGVVIGDGDTEKVVEILLHQGLPRSDDIIHCHPGLEPGSPGT